MIQYEYKWINDQDIIDGPTTWDVLPETIRPFGQGFIMLAKREFVPPPADVTADPALLSPLRRP